MSLRFRSFYYDVIVSAVSTTTVWTRRESRKCATAAVLDALARITSYMREHYQEELKHD